MKICHVNLAKGFRGGERQTLLLIEALADKPIVQTLICRANSELYQRAKTITALETIAIPKPFLWHTVHSQPQDLLHVHEGRSTQFAFVSQQRFNIPYLMTRRIPNSPKQNICTKRIYQAATHITCLSMAIDKQMQQYHRGLPTSVIPSMIANLPQNDFRIQQLKNKYYNKTIIGHIGALVNHHKGQQYIIEAAHKLSITHPHLLFLLIGSGKDEATLRHQAQGLNNVEFTGFVDNVGDFLTIIDIFIYPSLEEGLGSILLDAMEFGKPIIATNVGGIPDIIQDQHNGLLINPANATQLQATIVKLYDDTALQSRLRQHAQQAAKKFIPKHIAEQYWRLYNKLLKCETGCIASKISASSLKKKSGVEGRIHD